jgi:hypothetical protein
VNANNFNETKRKIHLKMKNAILIFIIFSSVCFFYASCNKIDKQIEPSSIALAGNQTKTELLKIVATTDGGFLVAASTFKNKHKQIWLLKYSSNMQVVWDYLYGGEFDNRLDVLTIDKNDNIIISGFSEIPISGRAVLTPNNWTGFTYYLNPNGSTIWEKDFSTIYGNKTPIENFSGTIAEEEGDYLCWGLNLDATFSSAYGLFPFVKRFNKEGTIKRWLRLTSSKSFLNTVFESKDYLYALRSRNDSTEVLQIDKLDFIGEDNFLILGGLPWTEVIRNYDSRIAEFSRKHSNGTLMYYAVFPNQIYRFNFDENSSTIWTDIPSSDLNNVKWAGETSEGEYLFVQSDGNILILDDELNLQFKFQPKLGADILAKLKNGNYLVGFTKANSIYLTQYDASGKIVEDE